MKGILYFFWGGILLGLLNVGWMAAGFKPLEEAQSQFRHFDDYMNSRGQYGQQR